MSKLNQPSGNPLVPLMARVYNTLIGDATLTALVPANSIGANTRKSLQYPCIEYGIETGSHDRDYKDTHRISITVYGTESVADTVAIADRVVELMKPRNLSDAPSGVNIAAVRVTRNTVLPRDDYGISVSLAFSVKYAYKQP